MTPTLTHHQRHVLRYLLTGRTDKEIARSVGNSAESLGKTARLIYAKFGVSRRGELMAKLMRPTEEALRLIAHPCPPRQ